MSLNLETMRTNIKILLVGFLMSTAFTSCKTASSLSEAKVFQKRKYNKGFHVNYRKANPKAETKSVTVLAFEELDRDKQITSVDSKEVKTVKISPKERTLITASSEGNSKKSASDKVNAGSVKWTKNIALPVLISEIFSKPPEDFVEQPMPAGAIIGFISAIVGLFIAGIPLGILAIILCGIAIGKINRNPGMRGKGLAIAGIVIGVIAIFGALIVISNM